MKISDMLDVFSDFYADFDREKALDMCSRLELVPEDRIKTLSKGTKEKMQLMLVMSRRAQLYVLDEPLAGVDPAAREFILQTILTNYNENGSVLISTHLITDVEKVLDEVIFLQRGRVVLHQAADDIREQRGMSIDELFREMFRADAWKGDE
jgi:ABC-2 type transport system ATP-binding protein